MNFQNELYRFLLPIKRKIASIVMKAVLLEYSHDGNLPILKVLLGKDEVRDNVEMIQPYGFAGRPKKGAEVFPVFINGVRDQGVAIVVDVSGTRIKLDADGDVAIYRESGEKIYLSKDKITITCTNTVEVKAPVVNLTDGTVKTLMTNEMMTIFNNHVHTVSVDPGTHSGAAAATLTKLIEGTHTTTKLKGA
jgi:phage gp45-like